MSGAGRPPRVRAESTPDAPRGTEPYGSIIERFRGTEWDVTHDRPEPPRNPLSGMLIVGGVVALLVVGTYTLVAVANRPPVETTTPSRFIATPQPTPGPADLLLTAFWTEIGRPTFGYHLTIDALLDDGTDKATESVALDVYADDFNGTADVQAKALGQPLHLVLLRSSGILYGKLAGQDAWTSETTAGQFELHMRPFLGLDDRRQLIVSGTAVHDGVTLQRLVSTTLYRPALKQVFPIANGDLPTATAILEILVTDQGVPVTATLTERAPADPANAQPAVDGSATYTFTAVDQITPIPSPKL